MKKLTALLLCVFMVTALFVGCGKEELQAPEDYSGGWKLCYINKNGYLEAVYDSDKFIEISSDNTAIMGNSEGSETVEWSWSGESILVSASAGQVEFLPEGDTLVYMYGGERIAVYKRMDTVVAPSFNGKISKSEIIRVSAMNNGGTALNLNGKLYTTGFRNNVEGLFVYDGSMEIGSGILLHEGGSPSCITEKDNVIYYAFENQEERTKGIYKINPDGSGCQLVRDNVAPDYMQFYEGYLYYSDADRGCKVYRCDMDGVSEELVLGKTVYWPFIADGKLIYQDDKDDEKLHLFDMTEKTDFRLNSMRSYMGTYDGEEYIYYLAYPNERGEENQDESYLARISLKTFEEEKVEQVPFAGSTFFTDGGKVYHFKNIDGKLVFVQSDLLTGETIKEYTHKEKNYQIIYADGMYTVTKSYSDSRGLNLKGVNIYSHEANKALQFTVN